MPVAPMPATLELPSESITQRSYASIADEKTCDFESRIRKAGHPGLNHVNVHLRDGSVILNGIVASFYLKQLAQEAVRPLAIGMQVRNELQVNQ